MVTLRDIAKEAGVSAATVSYVLNGSSKVSAATKERILKIVKEKGYRSNVLARSLRNNKSNLIGVIVEDVQAKMTPMIRERAKPVEAISLASRVLPAPSMRER